MNARREANDLLGFTAVGIDAKQIHLGTVVAALFVRQVHVHGKQNGFPILGKSVVNARATQGDGILRPNPGNNGHFAGLQIQPSQVVRVRIRAQPTEQTFAIGMEEQLAARADVGGELDLLAVGRLDHPQRSDAEIGRVDVGDALAVRRPGGIDIPAGFGRQLREYVVVQIQPKDGALK